MFSTTIQNYINSSGEANMRRRINQLESYVNSLNPTKTPNIENIQKEVSAKPFK